ncbi:hypothetical protein ES705_41105 [subsurface metagenome]
MRAHLAAPARLAAEAGGLAPNYPSLPGALVARHIWQPGPGYPDPLDVTYDRIHMAMFSGSAIAAYLA